MAQSSIEWTEFSWNPVTGCTKISPGCQNCYAEVMTRRLEGMGQPNYRNGFKVTTHEDMLDRPLSWTKPLMVFVNSMSDLFHDAVPVPFIQRVFDVMRQADWHQFQVLTKRAKRLEDVGQGIDWPSNIWIGVAVENSELKHRTDHLRRTGAAVKFLSLEPLLGPIPDIDLHGIDWVIAGGESGRKARPVAEEWVIDIRNQCVSAGVPFFFKQWGGWPKKRAGRLLQGQTWDQMPHTGEACAARNAVNRERVRSQP